MTFRFLCVMIDRSEWMIETGRAPVFGCAIPREVIS
jgi:hypothetical protein